MSIEDEIGLHLDWKNTSFLALVHAMALAAVGYLAFWRCSGWSLALGAIWMACCGISITAGYHRLFAHPTYRCRWFLRLFYLLFGAASIQNSALKWASDHRTHHAHTDRDPDPYNIRKGFWWAHIGWVLHKEAGACDFANVPDLLADPLVRWQHRLYVPTAVFMAFAAPCLMGLLWADPIGATLAAGFLRLVLQYHATFSVNSFAHYLGRQPYSRATSARDSFLTALITMGEGYHNFHHRFPSDYRNGLKIYQFDPTKWWVWVLSRLGITWNLRRTPERAILKALKSASLSVRGPLAQ